jgi:DNA polymerase-3 subunit epsilon
MINDWLHGLFPRLSDAERARLAAWRRLEPVPLDTPHLETRFVVVDVESSGLDVLSDRLIAIGAVALVGSRIALTDHFHAVLRQRAGSDEANILVHRIGGTAQTTGEEPRQALLAFLEFAGKSPLVAFHAPFDALLLRRAMRRHLGESFRRRWLDLACLAPALAPEVGMTAHGLDDWTDAFRIRNTRRHHALADAFASAQLLQVLQARAAGQGLLTTAALLEAARGHALSRLSLGHPLAR